MKAFSIVVLVIFVIWSLIGYFTSKAEKTDYLVIEKNNNYEIRKYPKLITAQVTVENNNYKKALSQGFSIIASYIFGNNQGTEKIAMTSPVTVEKYDSEKIAMTSPVFAENLEKELIISFVMPKKYQKITDLPTPNDKRIKITETEERYVAVSRFWLNRSEKNVQRATKKLRASLEAKNIKITNEGSYAGYNGPGTPPWMIKNEVMYEIEYNDNNL